MKIKDLANEYSLDMQEFENFLFESNYKSQIKDGFRGWTLDDSANISAVIEDFKNYQTLAARTVQEIAADEERKAQEIANREARLKKAEDDKKAALSNMLITSGFNFDGYTITKYSGYISGDDAVSVPRGLAILGTGTNIKDKLMESLVIIRRNALAELREAAYALGCNAVIGVDFDYLTLDPQTAILGGGTLYQPYVFGVTANGNAVVIEKNE